MTGNDVRVALAAAVDRVGLVTAIGEGRAAVKGRPSELRTAVEALSEAVSGAVRSAGLPEIAADAEAVWELVVPVNRALRRAREILDSAGRSGQRLDIARQVLLSAGAAIVDPDAAHTRPGGSASLAVVVPGPDGRIPVGLLDCEMESGTRTLRWYPEGDIRQGEQLFSTVMGRPDGYRYRWQDKRVWTDLAADLIVFCCGWHSDPEALPPVLKRSRDRLATELRTNFATGTWALRPAQIVDWLAHAKVVTILDSDTNSSQ